MTQNDPENTKSSKFFKNFSDFAILSSIRYTSRIRTLKTYNRAKIRCSLVFYGEIHAVFNMKNDLKMTPRMTKSPKFPDFQGFYAISVKFSTDIVEYNVQHVRQGNDSLYSTPL